MRAVSGDLKDHVDHDTGRRLLVFLLDPEADLLLRSLAHLRGVLEQQPGALRAGASDSVLG